MEDQEQEHGQGQEQHAPLRVHRKRKLLTQAELARAAGTSVSTVFNIEHRGMVGYYPHPSTIRAISAVLGVEPTQISEFRTDLEWQLA